MLVVWGHPQNIIKIIYLRLKLLCYCFWSHRKQTAFITKKGPTWHQPWPSRHPNLYLKKKTLILKLYRLHQNMQLSIEQKIIFSPLVSIVRTIFKHVAGKKGFLAYFNNMQTCWFHLAQSKEIMIYKHLAVNHS